ncbi:hypothetical protein [Curtobacterium luteum]|uniref:Asp23/Gls24 family envelope stress response protein n=1 Tax=Curtobacterium luteum TaxID=33881 RepID=A0A175RY58_9MICO|nr:hypothetical protein [Curtobacterium luteum]KTR08343.1 hypothetical protein NS184_05785 [Curtobacterium luteum]
MSAAVVAGGPGSGGIVPGWDRIGPAAIVHTAQAVASEALRAPFREVRARVADDGHGSLAVEITAPLVVPALGTGNVPSEPVLRSAHRARGTIAERLHAITGRQVDRVDVTYASSVVDVPRRVR